MVDVCEIVYHAIVVPFKSCLALRRSIWFPRCLLDKVVLQLTGTAAFA